MATCGAMTHIAITLHFAGLGRGEALVAAVLVSGVCAQVFVAPVLAPLFDIFHVRHVIAGSLTLEAATLVILALFPQPAVLIAGNLVAAVLSGLSIPALFTLAEDGRAEEDQAKVFSMLDTARLVGSFVGPAIGGVLLDAASIRLALLIESSALIIALLTIAAAARGHQQTTSRITQRPAQSFLAKIIEAPRLLLGTSVVREAMTSIWAAIIFTSMYNVALVFYATQTLNVSGLGFALIAQAFIVGRIAGAAASSRLTNDNALPALLVSGVVMGLGIGIPGILPSLWVCIPLFFIAGASNGVQVAALRLVVVNSVPADIKPKALSTMGSVNNSAMLVGYVVGAPVVAALGPATTLAVAGAGTVAMTIIPRLLRGVAKR
ncbi:MFS transporter [Corynebacterium tapiri]|uniref:MFS transporter n=1 Tax=Corynebacterium tapiri TaxID=1448266 RepID=A0A5C4U873_9CORY|nr:MFS transporter [Corynebacterium tapiri]